VKEKFPHLASLSRPEDQPADQALVPEILKGQIAVSAVNAQGASVAATGLQIPGVLDDLYAYTGELGVTWEGACHPARVGADRQIGDPAPVPRS
jgi:pullulanase